MKRKWYIDRISFRILFPALAGIILYLAMLMVFGNLENLSGTFFSQEALFLVILTYLNHELALFLLGRARSRKALESFHTLPKLVYFLVLLAGSVLLSSGITLAYFILILGYYYFTTELVAINILMVLFQLMVHMYYLSMLNIRKSHELSMEKEEIQGKKVELELERFKSEMNPGLLMECLEYLVILMYKDLQESDRYIQALSNQYRYMLECRKKEFVPLEEELRAAGELVYLLNHGGDIRISLECEPAGEELFLLPGTLPCILYSIEQGMILNSMDPLDVKLFPDEAGNVCLRHANRARLVPGQAVKMDKLDQSYRHYTGRGISSSERGNWVEWKIPRLPEIID